MAWLAAVGTLLQIILIVIQQWFKLSDEKKKKVEEKIKEVKDAPMDVASITRMFDDIARL